MTWEKREGTDVQNSLLTFAKQARYIGSLEKDHQLCDFYEIEVDGKRRYVYIPVGSEQNPDTSG